MKEAGSPNACVPQVSRRHIPGPGDWRIQLDRALQNPCPCVGRGESLLRYRSSKNSVKTNRKGHGPVGPRRNASIRCLLKSHCMARSAPCAGATGVGAPRSEAARKRPRLFAPRRAPGLPTGLWPAATHHIDIASTGRRVNTIYPGFTPFRGMVPALCLAALGRSGRTCLCYASACLRRGLICDRSRPHGRRRAPLVLRSTERKDLWN